ncbi:hypothetical protein [Methylocaldum sp.]|uniref:hypothetical protein n=1 Tax=Methylocaldum sp. TaxID=1969727 RepID=UPI002D47F9E4|nr:hypothetical protein [Methylocaldum sp.]HYE36405.1 hypothetical protein [Methylocaldum sp.]
MKSPSKTGTPGIPGSASADPVFNFVYAPGVILDSDPGRADGFLYDELVYAKGKKGQSGINVPKRDV